MSNDQELEQNQIQHTVLETKMGNKSALVTCNHDPKTWGVRGMAGQGCCDFAYTLTPVCGGNAGDFSDMEVSYKALQTAEENCYDITSWLSPRSEGFSYASLDRKSLSLLFSWAVGSRGY